MCSIKNVSIIEKNTVRIDYSAENTDFEIDFSLGRT